MLRLPFTFLLVQAEKGLLAGVGGGQKGRRKGPVAVPGERQW